MRFFCIGHKAPIFSPSINYTHVSPINYPELTQHIVPDDLYGETFHGNVLSEYTQLFGLAEHLRTASRLERLYIFQYRKFISFRPGSQKSTNNPYAYACAAAEATSLFPCQTELASLGERLLVGPALKLRSLAHNYSAHHLAEDFATFSISLSTQADFSEQRCLDFINCKLLFPAPSLGVTRVDIFLRHMKILRDVWGHFGAHFFINRSGYQRRAGGFLLERLHSFLLYEEIAQKSIAANQGSQIVISDSLIIRPTI